MFEQIGQKKSLSQQIEEALIKAIKKGTYSPGEKLPTENELCEMFQVSRTAIREAIKRMSAKGMVAVKRGSGVFVTEMSFKNTAEILNMFFELSVNDNVIIETIDTRLVIEPAIAAQAAVNRTQKHLDLLTQNMKNMTACDINNKKLEAELDNDFHKILLSINNNKVLELLLNPIYNLMPKFKKSVFAKPTDGNLIEEKNIMLFHHKAILEAIVEQNETKAFDAMKAHIEVTKVNYFKSHKG
ncbi:FadR/GntR family transcriptional regulator [Flavicella sediminum]|uniref:FadR/GntR family transcriptional regulator n=1 Tax=Flavicella sediminum TaxID=2585141 RepID=UPI00111F4907|nr:FadR/GntR family transcriptional regulator [Flavicella sediminum]